MDFGDLQGARRAHPRSGLQPTSNADVPPKWAKKLPEQIPAMRLGRLAGAQKHQGAGFGRALLVEALHRIARVADLAGGIGLFVDAKDEAAAFYVRFGFDPTPSGPLTLFMPAETIRQFAE